MNDETFKTKLADLIKQLNRKDSEICDLLHISQPGLQLWLSGRNLPYIMVRQPIIEALEMEVKCSSLTKLNNS